jgi:hypothetical protein
LPSDMDAAPEIFATAYIVRAAELIVKRCLREFLARGAVSTRTTG